MRKLATVQKELEEAKNERNLLAQSIETIKCKDLSVQISMGFMTKTGFETHVPELILEEYHYYHNKLSMQIKEYTLQDYKTKLRNVIEHIVKLELEKVSILHSLAKPLEEHELQD